MSDKTPAEVIATTFPPPCRVTPPLSSGSEPCTDGDCEHRGWAAANYTPETDGRAR